MTSRRPKIVVLGMMSKIPVAGVVWQNLHYLVGFERLGYEVWYVEAHARTPTTLMRNETDDSSAIAAAFIERSLRRVGLERRWAFHALHDDGRYLGLDQTQLNRLYREAVLIINLHGGTVPRDEHAATGRLVFLETDPVEVQIQLAENRSETIRYLEHHVAFFTFGENYGRPGCLLPVNERFRFRPTRQPIVLDFWASERPPPGAPFTTVGNWRQSWRDVKHRGETYGWSKHQEFLKVLDAPSRVSASLELALASFSPEDEQMLAEHGWKVRPASEVSDDPDLYRQYLRSSAGEFTVAKDQNVRLRTGWFSDRSASYLAAGRPVITQDTGFGDVLPAGEGLLAFSTEDEAVAALEAVASDPRRHQKAAEMLARDCFASDVVLGRLLDDFGLPTGPHRRHRTWTLPFPERLALRPRSRRPLILHPATEFGLLMAPVGRFGAEPGDPPVVTVVVVVFNQLALTRLCVETLLATWGGDSLELIVVDNASTDDTPAYLGALSERNPVVRVITNDRNVGFVGGCNQGLTAARGDRLVILNNDTVAAPGALERLIGHLDAPDIGLVGPLTNHAPNEARVAVDYETLGGLVAFTALHAGNRGVFELPVATLFCAATRRDVLDRVGLLDADFGLGLFDDDDFSMRMRKAGYRVVCATDAFVHHFGEASFGDLVPGGGYSRLFEENRARYEAKWGEAWQGHHRRPDAVYLALVARVIEAVTQEVPVGAHVAVLSRGDEALLGFDRRSGSHFPAGPSGSWSGHHPADESAVGELERALASGVTHLVIPATERWWLDHYAEFRLQAEARAVRVFDDPATCVIYAFVDAL